MFKVKYSIATVVISLEFNGGDQMPQWIVILSLQIHISWAIFFMGQPQCLNTFLPTNKSRLRPSNLAISTRRPLVGRLNNAECFLLLINTEIEHQIYTQTKISKWKSQNIKLFFQWLFYPIKWKTCRHRIIKLEDC